MRGLALPACLLRALLAGSSLALAACGAGGGTGDSTPPVPTVWFADDFSSGFPGGRWMVTRTVVGTIGGPDSADADPGSGLPAPDLRIELNGGVWYDIRTNTPFPSFPVTIAFDMRVSADHEHPFGVVSMRTLGGSPLMGLILRRDTLHVEAAGQPQVTYPSDAEWHQYEYREDAAGNVSWRRDGALLVSGFNTEPSPSQCFLHVGAANNISGALPNLVVHVDNVTITTE